MIAVYYRKTKGKARPFIPSLRDRVTVPAPLWVPQTFDLKLDGLREVKRSGVIVETFNGGGCAVTFDELPNNVVDYSARERQQFKLA